MDVKNRKNLIVVSIILFTIILTSIFNSSDSDIKSFNIGVVQIEGPIMDSKDSIKNLEEFMNRDDVHGIVLDINSPGGAVVPSQEIYTKVDEISQSNKKPIVASIRSLGASGGYYIAIGADRIIANPGSIVGSIGVIMNFPVAKDLLDKIGLKFETFKSGKYKDSGSPYRDVTDLDSEYFKNIVFDLHSQFINEVSIQRDINIEEVKMLSNGQIFTGNMAYENNLVDEIGTFEDALNIIKKMSNIDSEIKLIYPIEDKSYFSLLFDNISILDFLLKDFYNIPLYIMGGMHD